MSDIGKIEYLEQLSGKEIDTENPDKKSFAYKKDVSHIITDFEILYKKLKEEMDSIYEELERKDDIINYITEKYDIESNINVCKNCNNWFLFNDCDKIKEDGDEYWICNKCS
jgi:uncharacterized protein with PIN domain